MAPFLPVPAGTRYGLLTVEEDRQPGDKLVTCRCACGGRTQARVRDLRAGHTTSCGCRRGVHKPARFASARPPRPRPHRLLEAAATRAHALSFHPLEGDDDL